MLIRGCYISPLMHNNTNELTSCTYYPPQKATVFDVKKQPVQ